MRKRFSLWRGVSLRLTLRSTYIHAAWLASNRTRSTYIHAAWLASNRTRSPSLKAPAGADQPNRESAEPIRVSQTMDEKFGTCICPTHPPNARMAWYMHMPTHPPNARMAWYMHMPHTFANARMAWLMKLGTVYVPLNTISSRTSPLKTGLHHRNHPMFTVSLYWKPKSPPVMPVICAVWTPSLYVFLPPRTEPSYRPP